MVARIALAWHWSWRNSRIISLVVLVCLALPLTATSQTTPDGSIRGIVRDQQGAILPGVTVTATSVASPGAHSATTDTTGLYRLSNLPAGDYTISVTLASFAPYIREHVEVRAGLNIGLDVLLQVGQVEDAVHVTADSPLLERKSAMTAVNVSGEFQRALPTSQQRNWSDALILTPGVVSGDNTFGGLTQNYYVHGSNTTSHVLQVDGADLASAAGAQTSYISFSNDLIADVQVRTAGVDASSPLGTGAVLSVATRSGTDLFSGAVATSFQPERWNGSNVPGGTSPKVRLMQPDASLGGPVFKGRLWFFGAFQRLDSSSGVSRTQTQLAALSQLDASFQPFNLTNKANLYFFKLTGGLSANQRFSGFYQSDSVRTDQGSAQDALPLTNHIGGHAVAGRLLSTWGSSATSELGVSYNDKNFETSDFQSSVPYQQVYRSVVPSGGRLSGVDYLAHLGSPGTLWTSQPSTKATISYDFTYFTHQRLGSHELKAGVFLQPHLLNESTLNYANGGQALEYLVLADPTNPAAGVRPYERISIPSSLQQFRSVGSDVAFYVQDLWTFHRLTATAGLRVDRVAYTDTIFNVDTQRSVDAGPRVGLNYAVRADSRSVARLTWSRLPDRVAGASFAGTVSPTQTISYDLNLDGTFETVDVIPGSTSLSPTRVFDPNLHQPYVNEFTAGYRQQFNGQLTVDVGVVRRLMKDRFTMVEINGIYDGDVFKGYRDVSQNAINRLTNNIWNWPVYTALELTATKRTARVELIASYTRQWQHLDGTWQPNDPASFIQPAAFPDDGGVGQPSGSLSSTAQSNSLSGSSLALSGNASSPWQDHIVRSGMNVLGPWGLTFAANYTYQSGPWSGPIVKNLSGPDPAFGPSTVVLSNGRSVSNPLATVVRFAFPTRSDGQFHLDALHVLNLRFARATSLGEHRKLWVMFDLFNVTNGGANQGLVSGGNVLGTANYGIGQNRQVPRAGQIGAKFTF